MKHLRVTFVVLTCIPFLLFGMPHEHDPGPVQHEHSALFELVRHADATHVAIRSGAWAAPSTWTDGLLPDDGARVLIPHGIEITLDFVNHTVCKTIRVDGKLRFATDRDTGLLVDTLVIDPMGELEIGTAANPVAPGVTAKIIIADTGPVDIHWDPDELSRGLISHGRVTMHGEEKTTHLDLLETPLRRQHELVLVDEPLNWRVGDVLVVPGTQQYRDFDEIVLITAVNGNRIGIVGLAEDGSVDENWRGLRYDHGLPDGLMPFVLNLTRNVVVESQNVHSADDYGINRHRGHVMFMHSAQSMTDTRYVGAYGLGRTDKRTRLESPEFDEHGHRLADSGHNTVGRYAWHFHRGGPENDAATVVGLAIVDSPGLGLVNHSSNVHVWDSVAFNVVGSAWFTEAGNESGFFRNVAAVRMTGSGESVEARRGTEGGVILETDFGHSGHGFWLQGGGVSLHDVKVAGAGDSGIIFFTVPLDEPGIGKSHFPASLLADPSIADGADGVPVGVVPLTLDGALVFGCRHGVETKFHQLQSRHEVRSEIHNVVAANVRTALMIQYTNQLTVANCTFLGYEPRPNRSSAMRRNKVTRNIFFDDLTVRWWGHGLDMPIQGKNRVRGGVFQNVRDINITTTKNDNRLVQIEGDITFLDLTEAQLASYRGAPQKYQIYMWTRFDPEMNDLTTLFARDLIRLGTLRYEDKQMFYYAQAADYVPFPAASAASYVPAELLDLTNAELWRTYGLAIGDALAPDDAFEDPHIHALIGDPITYAPQVVLRNHRYSNQIDGYRLNYDIYREDLSREKVRTRELTSLHEGWNLLTIDVDGFLRTLLVFGDITPPLFEPSSGLPAVINPLDLKRGFRVSGKVLDNSFGERKFRASFNGHTLRHLPVHQRDDGTEFIELAFVVRDFARNETPVVYELTLSDDVLPAHIANRKRLGARPVSAALRRLLGFNR